jgi:excisionase family DNA binding protein
MGTCEFREATLSFMTSRSRRGGWQRVLDARRQSREALGWNPNQGDLFEGPPKKKSAADVPLSPRPVEPRRDELIGVLTLGEAASRLGISCPELEAMIAAGKIEALETGFTEMIPTREIERLARRR